MTEENIYKLENASNELKKLDGMMCRIYNPEVKKLKDDEEIPDWLDSVAEAWQHIEEARHNIENLLADERR